ncbi:tyrosine phosphatase family protein [Aquibium oceanicum]|uniref:Protein-tyrosine-phosphatase n=1 Tax=Aquibium oceanicum TaxID=1670800 RepID=A0A1L3SU94_9HYPH|nr:protein-tyrosine phosphatase family protein [Aquibium oceanicum]APH72931.1 protein-tyrosine-phosphatase [Aquibium oceanicum]
MKDLSISLLTICGLDEIEQHGSRGVTHVLSILDPDWPEPEGFRAYDRHHRTTLHFHDIIQPAPGRILPQPAHVEAVLEFGDKLAGEASADEGHLLVHCHMGVSRSTAAMATLLAQLHADADEDAIFSHLRDIRPQIWPNSLMIGYADDLLGRGGRMTAALRRLYAQQLERRPEYARYMSEIGRAREVDMAGAA